jgi:hypothetical protein
VRSKKENLVELKDDLADFLPREGNTDALLDPPATALTAIQKETNRTKQSLRVETAFTDSQLDELALVVGVSKEENQKVYKSKVKTAYQNLTQNGSPNDFLEFTSSVLNVPPEQIAIRDIETEANFQIVVPSTAVDNAIGGIDLASEILSTGTASTYGVKMITTGTLRYVSETEYSNNNYDTSAGYADTGTDTGGTYSGRYQE